MFTKLLTSVRVAKGAIPVLWVYLQSKPIPYEWIPIKGWLSSISQVNLYVIIALWQSLQIPNQLICMFWSSIIFFSAQQHHLKYLVKYLYVKKFKECLSHGLHKPTQVKMFLYDHIMRFFFMSWHSQGCIWWLFKLFAKFTQVFICLRMIVASGLPVSYYMRRSECHLWEDEQRKIGIVFLHRKYLVYSYPNVAIPQNKNLLLSSCYYHPTDSANAIRRVKETCTS